jgi:hypothetical protein
MAYKVTDAALLKMKPAARKKALTRLVEDARAPRNGQAGEIDTLILQYELRYEMSSSELLKRLANRTQRETADIADWLFWLNVRNRGAHGQARS